MYKKLVPNKNKILKQKETKSLSFDNTYMVTGYDNLKSSKFLLIAGIFFLFACAPIGIIILAFYFGKRKKSGEIIKNYMPEIQNSNRFKLPIDYKKYFTNDEISEIEYIENHEENKFEGYYDITDEWYQSFFKQAKKEQFQTLECNKDEKYSIISGEDGKYYFTSLKGCSCKSFPEDNFCEHMIINAINQKLINAVNGILFKTEDEELKKMINFINENMINSPYDINDVKIGLVNKTSEVEKYFENKGILEITNDFTKIINCFTVGNIKNQIPDLKEQIKIINPNLRMSYMSSDVLKKFISDNEQIFHKYFAEYKIVEFNNNVINEFDEYAEFAKWIKYCNKKYTETNSDKLYEG